MYDACEAIHARMTGLIPTADLASFIESMRASQAMSACGRRVVNKYGSSTTDVADSRPCPAIPCA